VEAAVRAQLEQQQSQAQYGGTASGATSSPLSRSKGMAAGHFLFSEQSSANFLGLDPQVKDQQALFAELKLDYDTQRLELETFMVADSSLAMKEAADLLRFKHKDEKAQQRAFDQVLAPFGAVNTSAGLVGYRSFAEPTETSQKMSATSSTTCHLKGKPDETSQSVFAMVEMKVGGEQMTDLGNQALQRAVVWMRMHAFIKRLFVFLAFVSGKGTPTFQALVVTRTQHNGIVKMTSVVYSLDTAEVFLVAWKEVSAKPLEYFLMIGGGSLMACLGQLGIPPRLTRTRFLAQSRSTVYSVALPQSDNGLHVHMHKFELAIKVFCDSTREDFKREVAALTALFGNSDDDGKVAAYAFQAFEWQNAGPAKETPLFAGGGEALQDLLKSAKTICQAETKGKGGESPDGRWLFECPSGEDGWGAAIVMKHGLVTKEQRGDQWYVTSVSLATALAGAGHDDERLLCLHSDMHKWFQLMANKGVTHRDMRPSNVVYFDDDSDAGDGGDAKSSPADTQPSGRWGIIDWGMARVAGDRVDGVESSELHTWSAKGAQSWHMPLGAIPQRDLAQVQDGTASALNYTSECDREMFFNACLSFARHALCRSGGVGLLFHRLNGHQTVGE
jgi:hypothetical protein